MALISPEDRHHAESAELLEKVLSGSSLSPYSLIELDLLLKSGEIVVTELKAFFEALGNLFRYRDIHTLVAKPYYHGEAQELRGKHDGLTYFDSLHAAVAIIEDLELVSYDKEYTKIDTLKYRHPGHISREAYPST